MIQIIDAVRDQSSIEKGKEVIAITYSNEVAGEVIYVELEDFKGIIHEGYILDHDPINKVIKVREIPFTLGALALKLKQSSGDSSVFNYIIENVPYDGIPLPFTVNISHSKNADPIVVADQIKGGHHVFESMYDFLYFRSTRMQPTMTASVLCKDDIIRTYSLNWIDTEIIPWPLKDADAGVAGSFRNYWHLQSESRAELPFLTEVEYAPDFNGGVPPFFENPNVTNNFDRYTFPEGIEWDDEREFTATKWKGTQEPKHAWKRIKEAGSGVWSKPIPINADSTNYVQENRFIRAFEKPHQQDSPIAIYSYFKGEPNLFASFEKYGRIYNFTDRQPRKRVWADLFQEEKDAYEAVYGTVLDGTDPEVVKNINKMYMTIVTKDIYGNLRSGWSDPVLIPTGDGNLVRYSKDGKGDINKVRQRIITNGISDPVVIDQMYEDAGWTDDYEYGVHNYMAYRDNTSEDWMVRQTGGELGQFTKDFYKVYPINYYDRINNIRTRGNYIPIGVNADNNPEDDITEEAWLDGTPQNIPAGYELYRATVVLSHDGTKMMGEFTVSLFSGRTPLSDFILSNRENFKSFVENTANGEEDTITREFDTIDMWANLFREGEDVFELPAENIKFVWRRIYNAGMPDDTVVWNNFGKVYDIATNSYIDDESTLVDGSVTHPVPDGFIVTENGKKLNLNHSEVNSSAIFELTIWRDVAGNQNFEGSGLEWMSYKSEKTLGDLKDRVIRSVVVSAERNQLFYKSSKLGLVLIKADFIGASSTNIKAFASNVDYTNGKWYVWNKDYNYDTLKETSTSAAWKTIESSVDTNLADTYWIDLNDSDLNHNVLWNSDGFETPEVDYNVYKFQASTPKGVQVYDMVSIVKATDGISPRDIKIQPETFGIPLNSTSDGFEGSTKKQFKVTSQNIENPVFLWELLDAAGTVVATTAGNVFNFDANPAGSTVAGEKFALGAEHYKPTSITALLTEAAYTIRVSETTTPGNLVEEGVIVKLTGGSLGIKGDDGEANIQVVFDHNDIIPSANDGTPYDNVSESTKITVYRGLNAQTSGIGVGEFKVKLLPLPTGVAATVDVNNQINVTSVSSANKDTLTFKVYENDTNPLIDGLGNEVEFTYKLIKSKAGESNWDLLLSNESQVFNTDVEGNVVTHTIDGVTFVIAKTKVDVFKGSIKNSPVSKDYTFKINGDAVVAAGNFPMTGGRYYNLRAATLSTNVSDYPYLRVNDVDNTVYVIYRGITDENIPELIDIDITEPVSGETITKSLSVTGVVSPKHPRRIELIPRQGTAFYPNDSTGTSLVFDVKFLEGMTEVAAWTSPVVKVNSNTPLPGISYSNKQLTVKKKATVLNTGITLESGGAVGHTTVVNVESAEGMVPLYTTSETLGSSPNTTADPYISLGAPKGAGSDGITYLAAKNGGSSFSDSSNGTVWTRDSKNAVYATWRKSGDSFWEAPFRVEGEKGDKGDSLVEVVVYKSSDSKPNAPLNTDYNLPPTGGWTLDIPDSGVIWSSKRTYVFVGDNNGPYGPSSQYAAFTGSSWSPVYRTTGDPGSKIVYAYAKTTSITSPSTPTGGGFSTIWKNSISNLIPGNSHYVWSSYAYFTNDDTIIGAWAAPYIHRFPEAEDGDVGDVGPPGPTGLAPAHNWSATSLRFKNPDGTNGSYTNLKGDIGDRGPIPAHSWSGTSLRFQNTDGNYGSYVDLKGSTGKSVTVTYSSSAPSSPSVGDIWIDTTVGP